MRIAPLLSVDFARVFPHTSSLDLCSFVLPDIFHAKSSGSFDENVAATKRGGLNSLAKNARSLLESLMLRIAASTVLDLRNSVLNFDRVVVDWCRVSDDGELARARRDLVAFQETRSIVAKSETMRKLETFDTSGKNETRFAA